MSRTKLKICVVTGSRAEYGLLWPLMKEIKKDPALQLQVVVTGMHLAPEFGSTYKEIEKDGFTIDEKIDMLLSGDTDSATIKSCGLGMIGFADALQRISPDWIVLLGDRFEIFAAAFAAHQLKIPIAHLHGGELTAGATDDAMRHAITKMSYLHFTAADVYRQRVIQLGEDPAMVFNTGAIGLDNIRYLSLLNRSQLSKALGFDLIDKTVLVTYHPVTLERNTAALQIKNILLALDSFPDYKVIFSLPNADADGREISSHIHEYVQKHPLRCKSFPSMGQVRYLSAMKNVKAVIGNSSSGIIEAPAFKVPTINIGHRQDGRLKANSIIDTSNDVKGICRGIKKAFSPEFLNAIKKTISPYGNGNAATQMINNIKKFGHISTTKKTFFDLF